MTKFMVIFGIIYIELIQTSAQYGHHSYPVPNYTPYPSIACKPVSPSQSYQQVQNTPLINYPPVQPNPPINYPLSQPNTPINYPPVQPTPQINYPPVQPTPSINYQTVQPIPSIASQNQLQITESQYSRVPGEIPVDDDINSVKNLENLDMSSTVTPEPPNETESEETTNIQKSVPSPIHSINHPIRLPFIKTLTSPLYSPLSSSPPKPPGARRMFSKIGAKQGALVDSLLNGEIFF